MRPSDGELLSIAKIQSHKYNCFPKPSNGQLYSFYSKPKKIYISATILFRIMASKVYHLNNPLAVRNFLRQSFVNQLAKPFSAAELRSNRCNCICSGMYTIKTYCHREYAFFVCSSRHGTSTRIYVWTTHISRAHNIALMLCTTCCVCLHAWHQYRVRGMRVYWRKLFSLRKIDWHFDNNILSFRNRRILSLISPVSNPSHIWLLLRRKTQNIPQLEVFRTLFPVLRVYLICIIYIYIYRSSSRVVKRLGHKIELV